MNDDAPDPLLDHPLWETRSRGCLGWPMVGGALALLLFACAALWAAKA